LYGSLIAPFWSFGANGLISSIAPPTPKTARQHHEVARCCLAIEAIEGMNMLTANHFAIISLLMRRGDIVALSKEECHHAKPTPRREI
jgi:hypothetical protein